MSSVHLIRETTNGNITTYCGLQGRGYLTPQVYAAKGGDCFVAVEATDATQGANCSHCRRVTNGIKKKVSQYTR